MKTEIAPDQIPVTCPCQACNAHIEFERINEGQTVACPHCGMETLLFVPGGIEQEREQSQTVRRTNKKWLWIYFLILAGSVILVFALVIVCRWAVSRAIDVSGVAGQMTGLLIAAAISSAIFFLVALWILFPVFVYFALQKIKASLAQIEKNTRP